MHHHHHLTVYALDITDLPAGLDKGRLLEAMEGHLVAKSELVATCERKPPAPEHQ